MDRVRPPIWRSTRMACISRMSLEAPWLDLKIRPQMDRSRHGGTADVRHKDVKHKQDATSPYVFMSLRFTFHARMCASVKPPGKGRSGLRRGAKRAATAELP